MPLFPQTATRSVEPELMDDPSLAPDSHRVALAGLARINAVSRSAATIWAGLSRHLPHDAGREMRVLDIACGAGDVGADLQRLARRSGCALRVDGCDLSPTALALARSRAREDGSNREFFRLDALNERLPSGYDATIQNLFLHHLETEEAVGLLRAMEQAAPVAVVNDLARGAVGYAVALIGTRLLSRSSVVHVDGPRSVRAAFSLAEARELARRAGLGGATVHPVFPWRWRLDWGPA